MQGVVMGSANHLLDSYTPTLGENNDAVEDGVVSVKLTTEGELQIKTLQPGMSVFHLRRHEIAVMQGHDTLCTLTLSSLAETFTRATIPPEVMKQRKGHVKFSRLLKPATVAA
jgi:hypothetical protein